MMEFRQDTGAHLGESMEDCLRTLGTFELGLPYGKFCNVTWDGILCWPPTLAGSRIRQDCPTQNGEGHYAYKDCNDDGTWAVIGDPVDLPGGDNQAGYTDYTQCIFTITSPGTVTSAEDAVSSDFHKTIRIGEILQFVLSSVSIVSCLIAILFYFIITRKGMRCRLVIPLFLSVMTFHMMSLVAMTLRHIDKSEDEVHRRDYFCKLEMIILKYSETATYSWLMVLSIYYHIKALRSNVTCGTILVLYVIGIGIPVLTTGTWCLCVAFLIEMQNSCFVDFLAHPSIWLTVAPKFLCIMVTFCMLVVCCYAFNRYSNNYLQQTDQPSGVKIAKQGTHRAFIAVLILTAFELYLLVSDFSLGNPDMDVYTMHYFLWIVCVRTRGLFLAIFICFVDKEIWSCQPSTVENSDNSGLSNKKQSRPNSYITTRTTKLEMDDLSDFFTDDDIP